MPSNNRYLKIKSRQEEDAGSTWAGSLVTCYISNCVVMPSILVPS